MSDIPRLFTETRKSQFCIMNAQHQPDSRSPHLRDLYSQSPPSTVEILPSKPCTITALLSMFPGPF